MPQPKGTGAMVRSKKGIFRGASGLTEQQKAFCEEYVKNGGNGRAASRAAGYTETDGASATRNLRSVRCTRYIRELQRREVEADGPRIAWGTLKEVCADKNQPGATRVKAAESILKWTGELTKDGADRDQAASGKALHEMTVDELSAMIGRLEQATDQADRTIEGEGEYLQPIENTEE